MTDEALDRLRELVEVNSFTHHRDGVNRVGDLCAELFRPLGFADRRVPSVTPECGDHRILTRPGAGERELLLIAHLDTVYPKEQEERDGFRWREEGGRIYGPGVADIKGGLVLLWTAMRSLADANGDLFARTGWKILLNATEEGGCADFPELARAEIGPASRACLVFEPGMENDGGDWTVVVGRRGSGRFRFDVRGREAHSGNAHAEGASALRELAGIIERIEALTDEFADVTFNAGLAAGGTAVNCVPGTAWCLADLRADNAEDFAAARAALLRMGGPGAVRSRDGRARTRIDVTELPGYPPWAPDAGARALADAVVACGRALGRRIVPARRRGASDACHVAPLLPTVDGLGPMGRNAHCSVSDPATGREPESIDKETFALRAELARAVMERLASA